MNDPAAIKLRYRTFAEMECRGYSEAHHERRRRLEGAIELARAQPPEGAGIIGEVTALPPPPSELRFLLRRTRFTNGQGHDELLGMAHPHGAELAWLEPRSPESVTR